MDKYEYLFINSIFVFMKLKFEVLILFYKLKYAYLYF